MSIVTYPLNETLYTAEDAAMYNFAISSGVASGDDFACSVSGGDNIVTVSPGIGWIKNNRFNGLVVGSKSQQTVDAGLPDPVYQRIDVVALQFDVAKNGTSIVVKKGTPSATPSVPERITTEAVYELYLCSILRKPSATVVSASDVTDLRMNSAYCGLMANSITKIDTDAISRQVNSLIEDFRTAIADVEAGEGVMTQALWSENGVIRVDKGGTGANNASKALENLGVEDYTVETGMVQSDDYEGNWIYKKYASGEAKCYGCFEFGSVSCTKSWGNMYESVGMYKKFPKNFFTYAPVHITMTLMGGNGAAFITHDKADDMTKDQTGRFTLSRPTSMTINNVKIGFEAIGRWK